MWKETDNKLYQKFSFSDFKEAIAFINQVANIAEDMNHHPEIKNNYNVVEISLTTHSAGGKVTDKDKTFAGKVDALGKTPPKEQSPPVTVKQIKLFTDGGSRGNPGPSASAYVIMDMDDVIIQKSGMYQGITTNNQAEYQAVKVGLEDARKLGVREVKVYMDSLLVVNQMKGIFKVKNRDLWPIHEAIKELIKSFKKVTFTHVPRELNKLADAEVNEILDAELKSV